MRKLLFSILASTALLPIRPAAASEPAPVVVTPPKITGYIQPNYSWGPGPDGDAGQFFLRRVRLKAAGDLGTPALGYNVMFELAKPQKPLRDAWVHLRGYGQELRFGQFKVPFGWEGPTSATRLPTIERSVVELLATGRNLRDTGLGLFGTVPVAEGWVLENGVAVVNGDGANNEDATPRKDVFGRLGVQHGKLLRVGASAASVETKVGTAPAERSVRAGADVGLDFGPLWLLGEYAYGWFDEPVSRDSFAWYALAVARLGYGVELLARYEELAPDTDEDARVRYLTGGANYVLAPWNARLQVNYRHDLEATEAHLLLVQAQYAF